MNYSILVVDDDEDDFVLLKACVKGDYNNIDLVHAQDGEEAIHQLTAGLRPHLILIDAHMPTMNGHDLLQWLMQSEAWRHVPTIIWTGAMPDNEVTRYYQEGANTVMLKQDALNDIRAFCHHWFELVLLPEHSSNA